MNRYRARPPSSPVAKAPELLGRVDNEQENSVVAISPELEAKILRYYHVEKWRIGTIARQLGVHHGTVDRVLSQAGLPKAQRPRRDSLLDPFVPFVIETLEQFPRLTASRLYAMVTDFHGRQFTLKMKGEPDMRQPGLVMPA